MFAAITSEIQFRCTGEARTSRKELSGCLRNEWVALRVKVLNAVRPSTRAGLLSTDREQKFCAHAHTVHASISIIDTVSLCKIKKLEKVSENRARGRAISKKGSPETEGVTKESEGRERS